MLTILKSVAIMWKAAVVSFAALVVDGCVAVIRALSLDNTSDVDLALFRCEEVTLGAMSSNGDLTWNNFLYLRGIVTCRTENKADYLSQNCSSRLHQESK